MMNALVLAAASAASLLGSVAEEARSREMSFTADRIAVDNVTKAAVASGHVVAVSAPYTLRSDYLEKTAGGTFLFGDPTCATTCTNAVGHTHWNVTGELEYREHEAVILRNAWLRFYEVPIFWLPYLYYPLETDCGFSWMPGYLGRWGAFLLTKTRYHLAGDPGHADNTWWLKGATRLDLRYKNGVALGEDLKWNLGTFGTGSFNSYYAWDQDAADQYGAKADWDSGHWGSDVKEDRYLFSVRHRWEATERDVVRLRATYLSDSFFLSDFQRKSLFNRKGQWLALDNSGAFWEHLEDAFSFGVEASGRLNDFYAMTGRLPEFYLDVNPMPLWGLPVNYESANRLGYLTRDYAEYGVGTRSVFGSNPGLWAKYEALRFDTYHRLTAPLRVADDLVSVVPRVGYRGTYWGETGQTDVTGERTAADAGESFRSIGEFGVTFAARGTAWVNDGWRHLTEPYLDVLAQEAWYNGLGTGARPYVFDSLDASSTWEDQFAGRSRNLPYSYYGITPGWRNVWSAADEKGNLRDVLDLDVYMAAQFNSATFTTGNDAHRHAQAGDPNYGKHDGELVPGARLLWRPDDDISLGLRGEYDSDRNRFAYVRLFANQRLSKDVSYAVGYTLRDHRYWDFSSHPYSPAAMQSDEMGMARMQIVDLSATHQVCDWLAWGPHIRWDARENELDTVGCWIDYLTDCLGFRLIVEYDNDYTTIDGYTVEDDWSIGFYVYLRALGASSGDVFGR